MKLNKETIRSKQFQRWLGRGVLVALIILLGVKLLIGQCKLWLCGLFVVTVTGYFILSDFNSPEEESK